MPCQIKKMMRSDDTRNDDVHDVDIVDDVHDVDDDNATFLLA